MKLYPIQFQPRFKYRIWGGNKLKKVLNKEFLGQNMWILGNIRCSGWWNKSIIRFFKRHTLKQLIPEFKGNFVGEKVYNEVAFEFDKEIFTVNIL